jgi:hypothetical protein
VISSRLQNLLWMAVCGIVSSAWCVSASTRLSATFDEPVYLREGLRHWRTGNFSVMKKCGIMPLPVDVCTLPLRSWELTRGSPIDVEAELETVLPIARAGTLVFWWLLLVYAFRLGNDVAGPWAGQLAMILLCLEPNLLAHATLATTDLAFTACLLMLMFHYRAARGQGWTRRTLLPSICFGLAILAKASAVVFGPLCLLSLEIDYLFGGVSQRNHGWPRRALGSAAHLATIITVGFALASMYCAPGHGRFDLSQALAAIKFQVQHNFDGHGGVFLLGRWRDHQSLWYYYPVALSIKSSLALLPLALVTILLRARSLMNWTVGAATLLLLFSLACRVQIGVRYFLPLIALATIGISAAVVQAATSARRLTYRRIAMAVGALSVAWALLGACRAWPDGLRYVNELWGGPEHGYLLLSDSNYDWGQGLKELAAWQAGKQVPELDVAYFGTEPVARHFPIHSMPLDALDLDVAHPSGLVAVSTTIMAESPNAPAVIRLRALQPVAITGTFFIYDLERERRAQAQLVNAGRP